MVYTEAMTKADRNRRRRRGSGGAALLACAALAAAPALSGAGPEVGSRAPHFEAVDQHGDSWDLQRLTGERGLLLLFFRSADW